MLNIRDLNPSKGKEIILPGKGLELLVNILALERLSVINNTRASLFGHVLNIISYSE